MKKPFDWHHSCTLYGQGENPDGSTIPCDPPCAETWQIDLPMEYSDHRGEVFPTLEEAMDWAVEAYEHEREGRKH